jgi:branched-chain amino acid aminotransferase
VERISSRAIPQQTKVSGAYVNSFNARRAAERLGFNDGIMLDREGRITEASAANFFAIHAGRLLTPPLNPDVFPGVTRQVILEIARDIGIDSAEVDLRADDLLNLDGAFLCSTLMEVRAISQLDDRALPTLENEIFGEILRQFREMTHS